MLEALSSYPAFNNNTTMCSVTQSWLTLCDPMDCNPPGSSVHGIFQARRVECVAVSFSRNATIAIIYCAMLEGHPPKFNTHNNHMGGITVIPVKQ